MPELCMSLLPHPNPELLLLRVMSCNVEYTFGQYGSSLLAMSSPRLRPIPNLNEVERKERVHFFSNW